MIVRKRDIKTVEKEIDYLEKQIIVNKLEISKCDNRMSMTALNIDALQTELMEEKKEFDNAREIMIDCKEYIKEASKQLDCARTKLAVMNGSGDPVYVRPCCKPRPLSEIALGAYV